MGGNAPAAKTGHNLNENVSGEKQKITLNEGKQKSPYSNWPFFKLLLQTGKK